MQAAQDISGDRTADLEQAREPRFVYTIVSKGCGGRYFLFDSTIDALP